MVRIITWLWIGCHEQLTVCMAELHHSLAVCGGALPCTPPAWDVVYVLTKWGALHMKNSECQRCTTSTSYIIPWTSWHHGWKFGVKTMWTKCFNFIYQVRHHHWAFGLRLVLSFVSANGKTAQRGTSINNWMYHPSKVFLLNALEDAPWHSKIQVKILFSICIKLLQYYIAFLLGDPPELHLHINFWRIHQELVKFPKHWTAIHWTQLEEVPP